MRSLLLTGFLLLVLAAGVACTSGSPDPEEDLRAIEALNQPDIDAVLSSDFDALISQWTEDFVLISPSSIVRGRSANAALMEGARAMADQLESGGARARFRGNHRRRRLRVPVGHPSIELPVARVRGGVLRRRQADADPAAPSRRLVEDASHDDRRRPRR